MLPRVLNVIANDDYSLTLTFDNYEIKIFHMLPYITHYQVFKDLIDIKLFKTVVPYYGSIQWYHEQDLCPDTLYLNSTHVHTFPRIVQVEANDDYSLTLTFDNNEIKQLNMSSLINNKLLQFNILTNLKLFKQVKLWYGMVHWNRHEEQYLRPDTCYLDSILVG